MVFHPLTIVLMKQSISRILRVVKSKPIRPTQSCVDKRNSIAAISKTSHNDRWAVPVRPK